MKGSTCARAALVEALFDGRLGPLERMSTERHLKSCSSCAELLRDLNSLREMLRSLSRSVSPLDHQRARLELLSETAKPPAAKRRPVGLLIAALLMLPFAVWASASVLSPRRAREVTSVPATPSETATQGRGARQAPTSRVEERATETAPSPTALPVASARLADVDREKATTAETRDPSSTTPPAPSSFSARPSVTRRARGAFGEKAAPSALAPEESRASVDFAEAVKALSRGDFGASAIKLDGFVHAYPGDPRVEDAAYLLAIALERDGRPSEAKAAARRYLAAYPDGAHSAHARRIAGD